MLTIENIEYNIYIKIFKYDIAICASRVELIDARSSHLFNFFFQSCWHLTTLGASDGCTAAAP